MRASGTAGFTFVELMCASAIFLFGLVGLLAMDNAAAAEAARASHQARARLVGTNVLALGQLLPVATISALSASPATSYHDAMGTPTDAQAAFFTVVTTSVANASGTLDVRVNVQWQEPQAQAARSLQLQLQRTVPLR